MLTLEVHGQLITWPEDIAEMMMDFYLKRGVPFKVYGNSTNTCNDKTSEGNGLEMQLQMSTF